MENIASSRKNKWKNIAVSRKTSEKKDKKDVKNGQMKLFD